MACNPDCDRPCCNASARECRCEIYEVCMKCNPDAFKLEVARRDAEDFRTKRVVGILERLKKVIAAVEEAERAGELREMTTAEMDEYARRYGGDTIRLGQFLIREIR